LGLHPGASNPNRRWSEEKWEGIIEAAVLRGFRVLVFGTRVEWTMHAPPHVEAMCEETDDLLWQCEQLARCQFFIGCDSGFAHVAGVLGMPGDVLFFSTDPKDVIDRYPNLNGIHTFRQIEKEPTRSLNKEDPVADEAREMLDVPAVVNACKWGKLTQTRECVDLQPEQNLRRYKLLVIAGGDSPIVGDLATFCDVRRGAKGTAELAAADLVVVVHQRGTMVRNPDGSAPWLYLNDKTDPEAARRAVREILSARG